MVRKKDEQIRELTQRMLQLTEELESIQDTNGAKIQQMTNAVQSLRRQLESKEKEIATLRGAVAPQSIYTQHPSTRGTIPPAQNHPSQVAPTTKLHHPMQRCAQCVKSNSRRAMVILNFKFTYNPILTTDDMKTTAHKNCVYL